MSDHGETDERIPVLFWATREELKLCKHPHYVIPTAMWDAIRAALDRKEQPWEGWEDAKGVVEMGAADNCKHVLVVPLED